MANPINTVSVASSLAGTNQSMVDICSLIIEELKAIRRTLGSATGAAAGILVGSATFDPASVNAAQATTTITVTGAALGDFVMGVSFSLDSQGVLWWGYVSAADTVTIAYAKIFAGAIDLASGTLRCVVLPKAAVALPAMTLTA